MPIFEHNISLPDGIRLGVWRIDEDSQTLMRMADFLTDGERCVCLGFKSERRKREWLATRLLIKSMLGTYQPIEYSECGKPYISEFQGNISISHADGLAVVLLSQSPAHESAVDVERITPRIERIRDKYLHPSEIAAIPESRFQEYLYIHWCAKEAMYKACNIPDYDYQNSYALDGIGESGIHTGRLARNGEVLARFSVLSHTIMDYVLCVATIV